MIRTIKGAEGVALSSLCKQLPKNTAQMQALLTNGVWEITYITCYKKPTKPKGDGNGQDSAA